jgi:glucose/arabinose dehydrogenase
MKRLYTLMLFLLSVLGFSQTIGIVSFATGFTDPVEIVHAGDSRLFVVQQNGIIKILNSNGTTVATPFMNISSLVSGGSEQGLLGLAFHPDYATNGFFYVNYTNTSGDTIIARYSVNPNNPNLANASSAITLKTIDQPFSNHNGGTLRFGPDGYLYIGMGDGGSGGDPGNRAQNKDNLLGKMLRLDVDTTAPYIPATNPYVGIAGADEVWSYGLRNPWKFSFDIETGNIWIADVGQENVEEINKAPYTTAAINYGWRCYEGNSAYQTSGCAAQNTMTFPLATYSSASGSGNCSVTGGYVYRGTAYPNFVGKYFFADYCSNKIGMINDAGTITFSSAFAGNNFTTFGTDSNNVLYVAGASGTIYKVIDTSLGIEEKDSFEFSMHPNPAKTAFSVKTATAGFPVQINIFDLSGKKIIGQMIDNEAASVNVDDLQAGLYMVTIVDGSGARSMSKLVVE